MVQAITIVSSAFAALMSLYLALLILRRWRSEFVAARRDAMQSTITRHYLRRAADPVIDYPPADDPGWPAALRLTAVSHLLLLLRGRERERLLETVDSEGLLDPWLRRAGRRRAATRAGAIRVLEQVGSPRAVRTLVGLMANDRSPTIRIEAAGALARLGHLPNVRDTVSLLGLRAGGTTRLHFAIMRSLAPRGWREMVEMLGEQPPASLRALLVDALGWSGELSVLEHVSGASSDPDPRVRSAALTAAQQLKHVRTAEWVIALLDDPDPSLRAQAALACGHLRLVAAVRRLRSLVNDQSLWVRMRAHEALAALRQSRDELQA